MARQFPLMRGIAIILVLINHSITMSIWMADRFGYAQPPQVLMPVLVILKQLGLFSVPIFLFLSGAFFAFASQNRPLGSAYRAVFKNLQGVIWPYLVWSLMFYLVMALLVVEQAQPLQYLKDLIIGYPYNFVTLLIFFYLVAPLLVRATRRQPILVLAAILLYQIFLKAVADPATIGVTLPSWSQYLTLPVIRYPFSLWGIFFPLGMVYHQHQRMMNALPQKAAYLILGGTLILFALDVLTEMNILHLPLAAILCPVLGMLLTPKIRRDAVPNYPWFESVGKRSYGLYLTNLIVITVVLFAIHLVFPWLLEQYLLLVPVLFVIALYLPWGLMRLMEYSPQRVAYRYIFG